MRLSRFALVGTPLLLTATIAAQIPSIPPAVPKFSATTTATGMGLFEPLTFSPLNATAMGATGSVGQIELRQLVSGNRDFYRVAATVSGLSAAKGGAGANDCVEGTYDAVNKILTAGARAAAFNSSDTEFAFSISENGLLGVSDDATGPQWSLRGSPGVNFPATQLITGVNAGNYPDSKIYMEGNQYKYAWVAATGDIWAGDFQANGSVTNQALMIPVTVAQSATSSYTGLHSPHPITEEIPVGSGNYVLHGWIVSGQDTSATNDSDSFFIPIADPSASFATPVIAQTLWNDTQWQNNGTTMGPSGTSFWAYGEPAPRCIPMVAMTGSSFIASQADTAHIHVMTEYNKTPGPLGDIWQMTVLFGAPIVTPIPLSFTIGNPLGKPSSSVPPGLLGNTGLIALNLPISGSINPGWATASFNIAANSVPANISIPMQVIGLNATTLKLYTGNTAILEGL